MEGKSNSKRLVYELLIGLLMVCLWVGWWDYEFIKPEISQEEIRISIRNYVQTVFQLGVQFIIPLWIIVYFVQERTGKKNENPQIHSDEF